MRGVDHDPLRIRACARQCRKDAVEHPEQAPRHEVIVKRLVRAIGFVSVLSLQAMLDPVDNPADHPLVIDTGHPVRKRKKGDSRAIWHSFGKNNSDMALELRHVQNHTKPRRGKISKGPEPSLVVA
jgi:hypothetical protein